MCAHSSLHLHACLRHQVAGFEQGLKQLPDVHHVLTGPLLCLLCRRTVHQHDSQQNTITQSLWRKAIKAKSCTCHLNNNMQMPATVL